MGVRSWTALTFGTQLLAAGSALAQPGRYWSEEIPPFVTQGYRGAGAMNLGGRVIGTQTGSLSPYVEAGFLWEPGSLKKMMAPSGVVTWALAIGDSGVIVGFAMSASNQFRAAVLSDTANPVLVPGLGEAFSTATGVNDQGIIVGEYSDGATFSHAFRWDGGANVEDLGTISGDLSAAISINNAGRIVGWTAGLTGLPAAFYLDPGGAMIDLNSLLPPGSPWLLTDANGVAESGLIVGTGELNGEKRGFTIDPSDPSSLRELPPLPGHIESYGYGVNSAGVATGNSVLDLGQVLEDHSVLWRDGVPVTMSELSQRVVNKNVHHFESLNGLNEAGRLVVMGPPTELSSPLRSIHRLTPLCDADFNADGFMSGDDFDLFVEAIVAGDVSADFDENGFVNGNDFDGFVGAFVFATGCP